MTLADFFERVPWAHFPYVEYLKVDAEGSDVDILRGAGVWLSQRVVYVTAEVIPATARAFSELMRQIGFLPACQPARDPTYFNPAFRGVPGVAQIVCRQS